MNEVVIRGREVVIWGRIGGRLRVHMILDREAMMEWMFDKTYLWNSTKRRRKRRNEQLGAGRVARWFRACAHRGKNMPLCMTASIPKGSYLTAKAAESPRWSTSERTRPTTNNTRHEKRQLKPLDDE